MNRECHGDYFSALGRSWYRCFLDSTIVPAPLPLGACPNCQRDVVGVVHGHAKTRTAVLVSLKIHADEEAEFELPAESAEIAPRERERVQKLAKALEREILETARKSTKPGSRKCRELMASIEGVMELARRVSAPAAAPEHGEGGCATTATGEDLP